MRVYIPQSEIDRIVGGRDREPTDEATKHAVGLQNSSDRPKPAQDAPRTPKERVNALVGTYGEWLEEVSENERKAAAGDPEAIAYRAAHKAGLDFWSTPEGKECAAKAYEAAIATWRTYPGEDPCSTLVQS